MRHLDYLIDDRGRHDLRREMTLLRLSLLLANISALWLVALVFDPFLPLSHRAVTMIFAGVMIVSAAVNLLWVAAAVDRRMR